LSQRQVPLKLSREEIRAVYAQGEDMMYPENWTAE
jgi:hypothetical protein